MKEIGFSCSEYLHYHAEVLFSCMYALGFDYSFFHGIMLTPMSRVKSHGDEAGHSSSYQWYLHI